MFTSTVCGLDGSRASFEAVRQAARLTVADAPVTLVTVIDYVDVLAIRRVEDARDKPWPARGPDISELAVALRERADARLSEAARQLGGGHGIATRMAEGRPADALQAEAAETGAALIAVGAHGARRLAGIALGHTSSLLLHEAPCAVLVARLPFDPWGFPRRIVVGADGSAGSEDAMRAASAIADAHESELQVVAAEDDDGLDAEAVHRIAGAAPTRIVHRRPVEALVGAAEDADLLIVGCRGRRGARSLGSVSERVAHRASSSVLVMRRAPTGSG